MLIKNIKQLVQVEEGRTSCHKKGREAMQFLPVIQDAFLIIENGLIADFGNIGMLTAKEIGHFDQEIDANGGFVLPCWCDSHTHLVFAKSREEELYDLALARLETAKNSGTGAIEIKSG